MFRDRKCISIRFSAPLYSAACSHCLRSKSAVKLAIDPRQQVEVESGGNARGIVIGGDRLCGGLDQIGAQQKRSPFVARCRTRFRNEQASGREKIADRAAPERESMPFLSGRAA